MSGSTLLIAAFLLLALIIYALYRLISSPFRRGPILFCLTCGHEGRAKNNTKGSIGIEIVLWLCFLVPGLIYSIWRLSTRQPACTTCGGTTLLPLTSPVAVKMRRELSVAANPVEQ